MRSSPVKIALLLLAASFAGAQQINLDTQVKGSRPPYFATDTGAANAYAVAVTLGPGLRTGTNIQFFAVHANTGASTLAVNGGAAIAIKKNVSTTLSSGDIPASGFVAVIYDGTNFQCFSCGFSTIGSTAWSALTNPSANLTLSMGSDSSQWKYGAIGQTIFWSGTGQVGISSLGLTAATDDFATIAVNGDLEIRNHASGNSKFALSNGGIGQCEITMETPTNQNKYPEILGCTSATPSGSKIEFGYTNGTTTPTVAAFFQNSNGRWCFGDSCSAPSEQMEITPPTSVSGLGIWSATGAPGIVVHQQGTQSGIRIDKNSATSGLAVNDMYLQLGNGEFGTNSTRLIGFGFVSGKTNVPAFVGYQEINTGGSDYGELILGNRVTTSDNASPIREVIGALHSGMSNNTNTSILTVNVASNSTAGGIVGYCALATDATNYQSTCGEVSYACVNKAGTLTTNLSTVGLTSSAVSTGTQAVTFNLTTGTNLCTLQANSNSTGITPTDIEINFDVRNYSNTNTVATL